VPNGAGKAIAGLGLIELLTGEPERAGELVQEALSIQVGVGDVWSQGQCHTYLTNKAVAADLQLSVRTVESHVRNALAKVGLENRTQLAAWARERIQ
jgi:hypothetical protein